MSEKKWQCCDCKKNKDKHEELWSFTNYGNNPYKKKDALEGNQRCYEHFLEAESYFEDLPKQ